MTSLSFYFYGYAVMLCINMCVFVLFFLSFFLFSFSFSSKDLAVTDCKIRLLPKIFIFEY